MHTIDGRDGGGQLVRTAVAMSGVTGTPVRMKNVRGGREEPGLRPQHLAAVELVAEMTDASTDGVGTGATEFTFEPSTPSGGSYEATIETAGSVNLVFDAVLPLAATIDDPAAITVEGGTDVAWSPPFDYVRTVKLPVLRTVGIDASTTLNRRGFYPSGSGVAELSIEPSSVSRFELLERGPLESVRVHSVAAESLESADVAERQADAARETLETIVDVPIDASATYADTADKGSVIVLTAPFESTIAGFSALGEPGKPSEQVASEATGRFEEFLDTDAAVDEHLADQVIPFLAIGGGRVSIPRVTDHVETHVSLVNEFGFSVAVAHRDDGQTILESETGNQGTVP